MKIKEYAADRGISTSAVYQSIKAHKSKIDGHIDYSVKPCELDDEAVRILDSARESATVPVLIDAEIRKENEQLRLELLKTQKELADALKSALKAQEKANDYLLENKQLQAQIEMKRESESQYRPFLFGLYKKVNR